MAVLFVYLRRSKYFYWLMWNIPGTDDNDWYYNIVEREIFGNVKI